MKRGTPDQQCSRRRPDSVSRGVARWGGRTSCVILSQLNLISQEGNLSMRKPASPPINLWLSLLAITLLLTVTLLSRFGQAQYVDSQRQAVHLTQAKTGSGTLMVVQSVGGGSVSMVQGSSAVFVIPQTVLQDIDRNGATLGLHNEQGERLFETVSEASTIDLPTAKLSVGTYRLTARSNVFRDTYVIRIQ